MGKFSDSPYFLLKDFFLGKEIISGTTRPIFCYDWPVIWTDRDYVTFEDSYGIIWNLRWCYDPSGATTDGSYLVGPMTNIVAKGDGLSELWIKEIDEPEKRFIPVTLRWKQLEDVTFVFDDSDIHNLQPGDLTHSLIGLRYGFEFFDGEPLDYFDLINNNREVYFRKDSTYHEWMDRATDFYSAPVSAGGRGHLTDIRNFVNDDTIFSYFGKIFKYVNNEREFRIIFDGLMEYVMRAIPAHQRTTKFDKFMEIFFDREWHEIYSQLKNIWTLIDPMEVDEDFLGYLSKYYYMKDLIAPTLFRQREFVRDLIWLLKRKGTYVEFYIIWRVIADTVNTLNIYEKWHDRDIIDRVGETPDTHVQDDEWQEYIYVEKPEYRYTGPIGGADIGWYNRTYGLSGESIVNTEAPSAWYNYPVKINENDTLPADSGKTNAEIPHPVYMTAPENRVLSTHYKLEIDVSTEPLLPDAIVNKAMWDELWHYWDFVRPVNRVVDYNILIAPITDFSGEFVSLYKYAPIVYDLTKVLIDLRHWNGWIETFTTITSACSAWWYTEPQGEGPLVPGLPGDAMPCDWIMEHPLDTKILHTMAVDEDFNRIVPDEIFIVDKKTVVFRYGKPTKGYGLIRKADAFGIGANVNDNPWNIYHYLDTNELVIETHTYPTTGSDVKYYAESVDSQGVDGDMTPVETEYATIDSNEVPVSIVPATSGAYVYVQPIGDPQETWVLPHNLFYLGVIVSVFNWDHEQIHEYNLQLNYMDEATLRFDSPVSGYATLIEVANLSYEHLIKEFIRMLRSGVWMGGEWESDLRVGTVAASGFIEVNEVYETDEFIYCNIKLDKTIEGSFREWGLYNKSLGMIVYSKNSEIYKPAGTTLVLHFRIEKVGGGLEVTEE